MPLLDLSALKARLDVTRTDNDSLLQAILDAALDTAAAETRRQLGPLGGAGDPPVAVTRTINAQRAIRVPDARSLTTVTVDGAAVTGWQLAGRRPAGTQPAPYLILPAPTTGTVVATGLYGFTTLPAALADAIYTHAARHYRERDALYGDTVTLDDGSDVHFYRQFPVRVRAVYDLYRIAPGPIRTLQLAGLAP